MKSIAVPPIDINSPIVVNDTQQHSDEYIDLMRNLVDLIFLAQEEGRVIPS